jgi:hypothetical protein
MKSVLNHEYTKSFVVAEAKISTRIKYSGIGYHIKHKAQPEDNPKNGQKCHKTINFDQKLIHLN